MQQGFNIKKIYIFVFINCFILYLWIATIFGYTSPDIALSGVHVENRFFSIGGFGNSFANFNINMFGYIAYIYLPLLLIPTYKLHDDTNYSYKKMQLTFIYMLLFVSCLILQSIIFDCGLLGNIIKNYFAQYISLFGVTAIAFIGIILSLLLISKNTSTFILKYTGGTFNMAMESFKHIVKNMINKIKSSYADLSLDYIQRANKKIINQELSEVSTTANTKYIFNEPLIELPLDEYKNQPIKNINNNQENIKVSYNNNNQKDSITQETTNKESIIDNNQEEILIQIKPSNTTQINNDNKSWTLPYQQHDETTNNKITHTPKTHTKTQQNDEDILKKFQQANTHLKTFKTQTIQESQSKTFQIKLSDDTSNPLEIFIKPQRTKEHMQQNQIQTKTINVTQDKNLDSIEIITKKGQTQNASIKINYSNQNDTNKIDKESYSHEIKTIKPQATNTDNIQIKPNTQTKTYQQDFMISNIESQPINIEIIQKTNNEDKINQTINYKDNIKQDSQKTIYDNMPLNSNYKTLDMGFTKNIDQNINTLKEYEEDNIQISDYDIPPQEILAEETDYKSNTLLRDTNKSNINLETSYNTDDINKIQINEITRDNEKDDLPTTNKVKISIDSMPIIQEITESKQQTNKIDSKQKIDMQYNVNDDKIQINEITRDSEEDNLPITNEIKINIDSMPIIQEITESKDIDLSSNNKNNHTNENNKQHESYKTNIQTQDSNKTIETKPISNQETNIMQNENKEMPNYQSYISSMPTLKTNNKNILQDSVYTNFDTNNFLYTEPNIKYNISSNTHNKEQVSNNMKNNQNINKQNTIIKNQDNIEKKVNEIKQNTNEKQGQFINSLTQQPQFILPSLRLLQEPIIQDSIQDAELDIKIDKMLQILNAHKIRGDIINTLTGPIVTTFEFRPETHVKVSKILSHRNDLALGLKAKSIRIQAPIPGKDVIGIEIPNNKIETIYLREILQSDSFLLSQDPLTIALGKDISGNPITANLAKLPHLLVAGTTGSGKSVGVNAIILSLLYRNNPDDLKLMMIDPKQVEFAPYEDLPHLITPIINAPNKAIKALQAATIEMDKRYEALSQVKAKNINSYNEKAEEKMPNFVIIIDELADLMITGGKEAEAFIARIAQMGRAAGIHLIIATQRSSVNVVTGHIKANLPSRISYRVGSRVDSKVILDDSGAEELLGNGDGLFTTANGLIRIHAPWVSEQEVENIVEFIKAQREPKYDDSFLMESKAGVNIGDKFVGNGGILDEAKEIILKDNKTSISYLQRKLSIGYNKAASLIETLEQEGFLSAPNSKGERNILFKE